jgi:REP element-mobilizing transposase RayT
MRTHIKNAAYHINWDTKNKFPFFNEDIFSQILIDNFEFYQVKKEFNLIAFKINPDHIHSIIQLTGDFRISQIVQSIKRSSSNQINQIIHHEMDENPYEKMDWAEQLQQYHIQYKRINNFETKYFQNKFSWHRGFNDVLIRNSIQMKSAIKYIRDQAIHHDYQENIFCYISRNLPSNINYQE